LPGRSRSKWLFALVAAALLTASGCSAGPREDGPTEASKSGLVGRVSYDDLENLHGPALRNALNARVKNHRRLGYNRARDVIFGAPAFLGADGLVECNYTGRRVEPDSTRAPGGFNTEHTWPQSMGAASEPAKSDLHHLFPVDDHANTARGSFPFGMATCMHGRTSCAYESGGSALGRDGSGAEVFEVRHERRGNVARAMFYFAVRYELPIPDEEEQTLRAWHVDDPVDAAEVERNDAVEALQHNRNPFVDHPELVARIADF
jgi:hypothetical protein